MRETDEWIICEKKDNAENEENERDETIEEYLEFANELPRDILDFKKKASKSISAL